MKLKNIYFKREQLISFVFILIKNYCKGIITIISIFLVINCSTYTSSENKITEVKIREAIINNKDIFLSDLIVGSTEYVKLETNKRCLLGEVSCFYVKDSLIVAFGSENQIFLFNRNSGKFIKEVGHYGNDPVGYQKIVYSYPYDEYTNTIFTKGWGSNNYNIYGIDENYYKLIVAPNDFYTTSIALVNDTTFAAFVWNYDGNQKTKLVIFNQNSEVIKTFPQFLTFEWDKNNIINLYKWDGWFYSYERELNMYERFSDTIFSISADTIIPRFVLTNGKFGGPYKERFKLNFNAKNYYFIDNIFESKKYLFLSIHFQSIKYFVYFNKETRVTKASQNFLGTLNNNFLPFQFCSTNTKGELVGYHNAYEIKKWFDDNSEMSIKLPKYLQNLRNVSEKDNPVVMIAKIRE